MFLQPPWTSSRPTMRARFASLMLATGVATFSLMAPNVFGQKTDNWTDSTGEKTVVAEFVKLEGVKLTLRKADGKEIVLPLSKLDDKSRLKARAMAKNAGDSSSSSTETSSGDGSSSGSKSSATMSKEPVSFPSNPTAQEFMDIVLRELKNDNPIVIWDALPASKQKEVEEVVKLASTRVEQKTLNLIKKFRGELLTTLKSKKPFILNSKSLPMQPDQKQILAKSYDSIVSMVEATIPIEWMDVSYLQNSDIRDILSGYVGNLSSKANALQRSLPDDGPYKAMVISKPESAIAESLSSNSANVTFQLPGGQGAPVKYVLSEGRWLPEGMVSNWDQAMAQAKGVLESANPKQIHTQVGGALLFANGLLGSISTAETQEEFDERIVELMGMARMGGGMPAPGARF
ncbi:MAG: SHD1 domain-containing protein [Planctomycetota bacterium]|nr:SHD1 domain-containing protein [Planctomycetota bacterium]